MSTQAASKGDAISYQLEFVAIGANRQANCASWGRNGLVAYAASKFVAIYDPLGQQLLGTLPGHTDRVTSAQWIPRCRLNEKSSDEEIELVSSSVDKTLIVWRAPKDTDPAKRPLRFTLQATLKGHAAPITALAVHTHPVTGTVHLASTSTDGTVILWRRLDSNFEAFQVFSFGTKLVESLAFGSIPGTSDYFLACGAVDNFIHIFASSDSMDGKFSKLTTLSGHESWIRSLAFAEFEQVTNNGASANAESSAGNHSSYLLLASASQDRRVRLWKFEAMVGVSKPKSASAKRYDPAALLAQLEANEEGQLEIEQHSIIITLPYNKDDGKSMPKQWSIQLESVILGHDDWVLSVQWMPPIPSPHAPGKYIQLPRLLTASMDKTMTVWTPDPETSVWIEATRVGAVGGNHLGFFGGLYGIAPYEAILALGYNGAFHLWRRSADRKTEDASTSEDADNPPLDIEEWHPQVTISGHFSDVKDVAWEPSGAYFVSVSKDQTARIWARWNHKKEHTLRTLGSTCNFHNSLTQYNWHELARPQVHGHDLTNITFQYGIGHRLVSCAEEKVIRVFDAPMAFLKSMVNLSEGVTITSADASRAASANVPALGLSNKPVYEKSESAKNAAEQLYEQIHPAGGYGDFDINADREGHVPLILSGTPPFEEQLLQRTLWPEIAKLYGHGNDLVTVTSSRTGDIIASACSCKVQTQEQAGIRIWDTSLWKGTCELAGPTLTVTQMQFSHCDQYLLAVSRDRGVYLFRRNAVEPKTMELAKSLPEAHLRVVWTCSWTWNDQYVATGSRDKTVIIWTVHKKTSEKESSDDLEKCCTLTFKSAVTSVAWLPDSTRSDQYVLAVGMENGLIQLWQVTPSNSSQPAVLARHFHSHDVHVETIKKMVWQKSGEREYCLVTGSSDQSVRLFRVSTP